MTSLNQQQSTAVGFFSGMGQSDVEGDDNPYALTSPRVYCGEGCHPGRDQFFRAHRQFRQSDFRGRRAYDAQDQ